eukprot:TRINITY_DN6132_c0_g1_i1.p1 TRINITY_DN6132_c0_g1~~TRINITY_DN6132_c0_g1_i1.p1  ORF type:complete len:188 (-),score=33.28 TRINITY_DN6132_c0_g1_i1:93-656(-)
MQCEEAANKLHYTDPKEILKWAHNKVNEKAVLGSCTACLISVTSNKLQAINLGDSGFFVLRDGNIILRSVEQQHKFNFPYQLGFQSLDTPNEGDLYTTTLEDGDLIVVASDGVFDNVYLSELVALVTSLQSHPVQTISKAIADEAKYWGKKKEGNTPFSENARLNGFRFDGGKEDDITVIVARFRSD